MSNVIEFPKRIPVSPKEPDMSLDLALRVVSAVLADDEVYVGAAMKAESIVELYVVQEILEHHVSKGDL